MTRKIFDLWDKHTKGFCRVLTALMLPAAVFDRFAGVYACLLLLLWLIVHTGYSKGWDKSEDEGSGNDGNV